MRVFKARKKPVEVDICGPIEQDDVNEIARWITGQGGQAVPVTGGVDIPTLEGQMRASLGDYVIRGVKGEFYPCKPDIFAATYDEVGPQGGNPTHE